MLGRDIGLRTRSLLAGLGLLVLPVVSQAQAPEYDPWEPVNLKIHAFNDKLDAAILRPVAESYSRYVPRIAQRGVSNFFSNLNDVTVLVNNILQLKIINAASDTGRIVLNTT